MMTEILDAPPDRLAAMFARVRLTARVFHAGRFCGAGDIAADGASGHLHLLRAGEVRIEGRGTQALMLEGPAAVLLPRPAVHRLATDPDKPVDLVCAEIGLGGPGNPLERGLPDLLHLPLVPDDRLGAVLAVLFAEAEAGGCGRQVVLDRLVEVVLVYLLRAAMDRSGQGPGLLAGLGHPSLARVLVRLHENPAADWTLERMAEEAGMSRSSFAETFRRVVGQTPGDYVQGWRLGLARAGLASGRTLKQMAREVGYDSHAALSRALSRRKSAG
ncbi:MAG TPA: AraC family transcriptional regulator [Azospirillaceae bacterium]|nr:AraC family transcriptional regulator [Azospirillaceae bacterium]